MDLDKLVSRFRQFGGMRLIREYHQIGALGNTVIAFFHCMIRQQSFKGIYPEVLKKTEPFLREKYEPLLKQRKVFYRDKELNHCRSRYVWFCWLQGLDRAPKIVKTCYNSIRQNLINREIKVINNENWKDYVELPDYIVNKWEKQLIPPALFSDLLRVELLIKYGGSWIDSTVLCTDGNKIEAYLNTDLFLFQYTRPGTNVFRGISNWFITSCSNNEVIMVLRDMLHAYWEDYDCTLDYYIFHLFFSMLVKEYPEQIMAMPYGYSMYSLSLLHHWEESFDEEKWERLTNQVCIHKLAFRVSRQVKNNKENYYNKIVDTYESI